MISFLVPFRPDGERRDENWRWVRRRLATIPDSEIVVGHSPAGPFNTSAATNDAASRAQGDVFCIHDADIALPAEWYARARENDGWSIPEGSRYLTDTASRALLRRSPAEPLFNGLPVDEEVEFSVGGVVMLPRETFFAVGGKDARFTAWGPEDAAFSMALSTLGGERHRFGGPLTHLWHPRLPNTRPWSDGAPDLLARYQAADGDIEKMRGLVA